jgi:hypothetical protein
LKSTYLSCGFKQCNCHYHLGCLLRRIRLSSSWLIPTCDCCQTMGDTLIVMDHMGYPRRKFTIPTVNYHDYSEPEHLQVRLDMVLHVCNILDLSIETVFLMRKKYGLLISRMRYLKVSRRGIERVLIRLLSYKTKSND